VDDWTCSSSEVAVAFQNPPPCKMPVAVSDDDIDYSDIEAKCVRSTSRCLFIVQIFTRYQLKYEETFDSSIVVDGVPIIDKSKLEKLLAKISKAFSKKGAPIKPGDIFMPWDDATGKSKGYVLTPTN
jgi:translation initiation factor 3 subunit B